MINPYLTSEDIFYNNLKGHFYSYINTDFKYCIQGTSIGSLILKFNKTNEDIPSKQKKKYFRVSTNELVIGVFFVHLEDNDKKNLYYNERVVKKYIYDCGFNIINRCDVKYINFTELLNRIISHPSVNSDNLKYGLNVTTRRSAINISITSFHYIYHTSVDTAKRLTDINQIKFITSELFDEIKLFFNSQKKINDVMNFLCNHNFYSPILHIGKYNLKAFSTFYSSFNKVNILKHLENEDNFSLNRFLTLAEKIEILTNKGQMNPINITIKGIKIIAVAHQTKYRITFEIPLFPARTLDSIELNFLYAYLSSIDEFDSLVYKFEREYLSAL